jgi:hypothetical protein
MITLDISKKFVLIVLICLVAGVLLIAGYVQKEKEYVQKEKEVKPKELNLSDFPEVFKESTLIVVGDNASEIEMQAANEIAEYLKQETGNKPLIKKYSEVSEEDKRTYNLIIVGTPNSNPMLREVYATSDVLQVNESFPGEGKGVLEILKNPWEEGKAILLVEGSDERGVNLSSERLRKGEINASLLHFSIRRDERFFIVTPITDKIAIEIAKNHINDLLKNYPTNKISGVYLSNTEITPPAGIQVRQKEIWFWCIEWFLEERSPEALPPVAEVFIYVDASTGEIIGIWSPE